MSWPAPSDMTATTEPDPTAMSRDSDELDGSGDDADEATPLAD